MRLERAADRMPASFGSGRVSCLSHHSEASHAALLVRSPPCALPHLPWSSCARRTARRSALEQPIACNPPAAAKAFQTCASASPPLLSLAPRPRARLSRLQAAPSSAAALLDGLFARFEPRSRVFCAGAESADWVAALQRRGVSDVLLACGSQAEAQRALARCGPAAPSSLGNDLQLRCWEGSIATLPAYQVRGERGREKQLCAARFELYRFRPSSACPGRVPQI